MGFSSIAFLFFFLPIFLAAYFAMPTIRAKNLVCLTASLLFYASRDAQSLPILLVAIAINTYAALAIDRRQGRARGGALAATIVIDLLILVVFKYAGFLGGILAQAVHPFGLRLPTPNTDRRLR
ncbi:MAG TPA: hypothetical protein VGC82_06305 [Rhodopila sp.]